MEPKENGSLLSSVQYLLSACPLPASMLQGFLCMCFSEFSPAFLEVNFNSHECNRKLQPQEMKCSSKHTIPIIFMAKIQNQALNSRVMTLAITRESFSDSITSFSCSPRHCYFCQIPGYFLIQMEKKIKERKKEGVKRKQKV